MYISSYKSSEVNASLDHLLGVFGLGALAYGHALLLGDFLLLGVLVVEPDRLVKRKRLLVLVLYLAAHPPVLESVVLHLGEALVLLGPAGLVVDDVAQTSQRRTELLPGDLAVLVRVELLHEHAHLVLKRGEPVGVEQQVFNFVGGDEAAVVHVHSLEAGFEFLLCEDVDAERTDEGRLKLVGRTQRRYPEERHFLYFIIAI